LDTDVVHHRLGKGHVAEIVDAADVPRAEAEPEVRPPIPARHVPDGARPEVLVALGRAVAGAVRHPDERDVAAFGVLVPGAPEEGRNPPPVPGARLPFRRLEPLVAHLHRDQTRAGRASPARLARRVSSQSGSISGTEDSRSPVYSGCGGVRTSLFIPCSTTRPRHITTISSAIAFTVARSCVMNRYDTPSSLWSRSRSFKISSCTSWSSAEVTSSQMISWGSAASARAIQIRCF